METIVSQILNFKLRHLIGKSEPSAKHYLGAGKLAVRAKDSRRRMHDQSLCALKIHKQMREVLKIAAHLQVLDLS
jgi:hypothetical protein